MRKCACSETNEASRAEWPRSILWTMREGSRVVVNSQHQLIHKPVLLAITVQEFFKKTFVGETCQVVCRTQLEQNRHRDAPGHPLTRIVAQLPTPAQKTLYHSNLRLGQIVDVGLKGHCFKAAPQSRIGNRRSKNLRE